MRRDSDAEGCLEFLLVLAAVPPIVGAAFFLLWVLLDVVWAPPGTARGYRVLADAAAYAWARPWLTVVVAMSLVLSLALIRMAGAEGTLPPTAGPTDDPIPLCPRCGAPLLWSDSELECQEGHYYCPRGHF